MKYFHNLLRGKAKFYPAATPNYARAAARDNYTLGRDRWNDSMVFKDLNYSQHYGTYFNWPYNLISAGAILGPNQDNKVLPMMTDFDQRPPDSSVLLDSGGYGLIANPQHFHGDITRERHLNFTLAYRPNGAMTLDIPPRNFTQYFPDYEACRDTTLDNLAYIAANCPEDKLGLFLNILQGEDNAQIENWYNAVRGYPFPHWAFAGTQYKQMPKLLKQLVIMRDDGSLEHTTWVHNLGIYKLTLACALSTVQEALSDMLDKTVNVTYDSAFLFNNTNENGQCVRAFNITKRGLSVSFEKLPDNPKYVGSTKPFPFSGLSEISKGLTLGDLCRNRDPVNTTTWDDMSYLLVENHNIDTYLTALEAAHNRYLLPAADASNYCPQWFIRAKEGIRKVLFSETPMAEIERYRKDFEKLNQRIDPLTMADFQAGNADLR